MTYKNANKFMANDMPDEVFDATQCKIRWSGVERSSKKNCFEVFHEKSIVLFYHDEFNEANLWLVNFKEIENRHKANHKKNENVEDEDDKSSIRQGLNKFFKRRPGKDELEKKGICSVGFATLRSPYFCVPVSIARLIPLHFCSFSAMFS